MADANFKVKKGLTVGDNIIITFGSNVAIGGNTTPAYNLQVNGNIYSTTLLVSSYFTANSTKVALSNTVGLEANGEVGTVGQVLTSNGTVPYWSTAATGSSSNTQVHFNDSGSSNGSSSFIYNKATTTLTVSGTFNDCGANTVSQTLSDEATISWDTSLGRIATITVGATGRTMAAPTNLKVGTYILHVKQDSGGSKTITTWNAVFKWPAGVAPILSTTASYRDVMSFICDGTSLYGTYITGFTS